MRSGLLALLVGGAAWAAAPVRLAIWPEGPVAAAVADLLTVALTDDPALDLVERAQLDRLVREQEAAAGAALAPLEMGRLTGADGLLFLRPAGSNLLAQLVAVKPGLILNRQENPASASEWADLVKVLARQVRTGLPKLAVARDDAVPISVAAVRSSFSDPASQAMERQVRLLLLHRLAADPRVFVLDRERMQALAAEKAMDASLDTAFWTSAHVLEATLNPSGLVPGQTTVELRAARPGAAARVYTVSHPAAQPSALVEALVAQLLSDLAGPSSGPSVVWHPLEEAALQFEEAQWAYRHGLRDRLPDAVDAAWALGLRTEACAELRARHYAERAVLPRGRQDEVWPDGDSPLPRPDEAALGRGVTALEACEDFVRLFPLQQKPENPQGWVTLGLSTLDEVSVILKAHLADPGRASGQEGSGRAAQLLRSRCRAFSVLLEHAVDSSGIAETPLRTKDFNRQYHVTLSAAEWLGHVRLRCAGLWFEDPRQAADLLEETYRRYPPGDEEAVYRLDEVFFNRSPYLPWLADWSGTSGAAVQALALQSCRRLADPARPRSLLHGSMMELQTARALPEVAEAARHLGEALTLNRGWARGELFEWELPDKALQALAAKWQPLTVASQQTREETTRAFIRKLLPVYLKDSPGDSGQLLSLLAVEGAVDPADATRVRALWDAYVARSKLGAGQVERYGQALGFRGPAVPAPVLPAVSAPAPAGPAEKDGALTLTPFHAFDAIDPITDAAYPVLVQGLWLEDDRLWVEGAYTVSMVGVLPRAERVLLEVDLNTGAQRATTLAHGSGPGDLLLVRKGTVYRKSGAQVEEWNLAEGTRRRLSIPVTPGMRLWDLRGGLFAFSDRAILRYERATDSTTILASSKRKPARTALDEIPALAVEAMQDGPDGDVCALVGGIFYQGDVRSGAWRPLGPVAAHAATHVGEQGVLQFPAQPSDGDFLYLAAGTNTVQRLFRVMDRFGRDSVDGLWPLPEDLPYTPGIVPGIGLSRRAAFDGRTCWVMGGPYLMSTSGPAGRRAPGMPLSFGRLDRKTDRDATLWRLRVDEPGSWSIPLVFERPARAAPPDLTVGFAPAGTHDPAASLKPTSTGLLVLEPDGYWLLPYRAIEAYVAAHPACVQAGPRAPPRRADMFRGMVVPPAPAAIRRPGS
jgi:hypothetical protein